MYLERLSVFDYSLNKYYKPNGTFNTRSATDDLEMPNCTMYCFLRMHESTEQESRQNYWIRKEGGFGNAKTWYATTTLPKGSEIRDGAIAVFNGVCGHVAFVERKIDDTHAYLTESNYSQNKALRDWHFFNKRPSTELVVGKATIKGCGELLGFIYLPINDIRVSRDKTKHQVLVDAEMVNVRVAPEGDIACKGLYCPMGIYNVLSTQKIGDYVWYEFEKDRWVREGEWTTDYPVESGETEELKKEIERLKAKLDKIQSEAVYE